MDLSGLKWPAIILVVAIVGWLLSSGGVNWMIGNFSKSTVGQDAKRDIRDEAGLSRVGGFLYSTWRWEKAAYVFDLARSRYSTTGKNYYYNTYRLARCYDRLKRYQETVNLYRELSGVEAHSIDRRVPYTDSIIKWTQELVEMHGLQ